MATSTDKRKTKIKLPKVHNKQTSQETSAPFQFSSANWNADTEAYKESVHKQGQKFVKEIFAAVHAHKLVRNGNGMSAGEGNGGNSGRAGARNPCATLYKIPFQLVDCANQLLLGLSFILAAGSSEPSLPVAHSSSHPCVHLIPTFISFSCSSHPCVRLHPHIRHLHVCFATVPSGLVDFNSIAISILHA